MKFGAVPLSKAEGAILAHASLIGGKRLRKGLVLGAAEIATMKAAGLREVIVAMPDAIDIDENTAATRVAGVAVGAHISATTAHAGRVNLIAGCAGVLDIDISAVNRFNAIDPAITLATLPPFARVAAGQLLATLKIIPYAVKADAVAAAAVQMAGALLLRPVCLTKISLVLSQTGGMKPSLLEKGRSAVEARLARLGLALLESHIVPHETGAMAAAISAAEGELVLVLGASATCDIGDIAPEAVRQAGGEIMRFGIPVDPGNLLFIGSEGGRPVLGLPGCARALALNGADWVLERLLCGIKVDEAMLVGMGVGGLLREIPTRSQPRRAPSGKQGQKIAVLLLGAGQSRRMRGRDKLLEPMGASTMLAHAACQALASKADAVFVALPPGHDTRLKALDGLNITPVPVPDFAEGMGASLRTAMAKIGGDVAAVIVALADMPEITPAHYNALINAYDPEKKREICRALAEDGTPGHPVLFGQRFFESLAEARGDAGGRAVLQSSEDYVYHVKTSGRGAVLDLDTPEAWARWRQESQP